nr:hypothetical protein [uncultured Roseibium sp.]
MPYFNDQTVNVSYDADTEDMGFSSHRFGDVDAIMDNLSDDLRDVLDQVDLEFGDDGSDDFELYEEDDWSDYDADYVAEALESGDIAI